MPILIMGLVAFAAFSVVGILLFSAGMAERREREHSKGSQTRPAA